MKFGENELFGILFAQRRRDLASGTTGHSLVPRRSSADTSLQVGRRPFATADSVRYAAALARAHIAILTDTPGPTLLCSAGILNGHAHRDPVLFALLHRDPVLLLCSPVLLLCSPVLLLCCR